MRATPAHIWDVWQAGGPFVGDDAAPHGRVLVETDWELRVADGPAGYAKGPVRHWYNPTGTLVEVPGVRTIAIDRSLESDAQTCTITLHNVSMPSIGSSAPYIGDVGHYTWNRGASSSAAARWGHTPNSWADVLVPNALLRTYQGYGGRDKTVANALADGNIALTGVWLVDEVRIATDGRIELKCRDMAKLLIVQQLFKPLVPNSQYPHVLRYCRWASIPIEQVTPKGGGTLAASSEDPAHPKEHAFENDPATFWCSASQPTADTPVWIEFTNNGFVDRVVLRPWGGNYHVYVSVFADGAWVGEGIVGPAPGGGPAYIADSGTPYDQNIAISLGASYNATKIRLTFTNLMARPEGGFRCGIREWESEATEIAGYETVDGNYKDYAEIVKDFLLWAGFYNPTGDTDILGFIEDTGAYAEDCINETNFDKRPVIDGVNLIKEIVGYLCWVDDDGSVHFESPNWWEAGNFLYEDGSHTSTIPDIDEKLQLTEYAVAFSDASVRSQIVISTTDPSKDQLDTTRTTYFTPPNAPILKGIVRPFTWSNGVFTSDAEREALANLIAIHTWFVQRQGQLTMQANPLIQVNDQVRIWERQTAESYVHYVRAVTSQMDLESGSYTMTLTTHWLGEWPDGWGVQDMIGPALEEFLSRSGSPSTRGFFPTGEPVPIPTTAGAG